MAKIRVLAVGCGNMGASHAKAYHEMDGFEICGIVSRTAQSREKLNAALGGGYPLYADFDEALAKSKPNAVSISTYPDTHEELALKAIAAGCHVFVEKPLSTTVEGAQKIIDKARAKGLKVVVGYILRQHPSWIKFIELARTLGKPLVMRMNLNQQSHGYMWNVHKNLMKSASPIVDCGVHYVDVMCQMTQSKPVSVHAIGAHLSDEIAPSQYNYGQLQVRFADGSVGWYEAGWGPMASQKAFFIKDVWGPKGSVTIDAQNASADGKSSDVDSHTKTEQIRYHHAEQNAAAEFVRPDEWFKTDDEPTHDGLCRKEQEFFYDAIVSGKDIAEHMDSAVNSLRIVLAADKSVKTGMVVEL